MKHGKFGICLAFYAILGFVLALLKQPLLCGLLLGFVIMAEGDRWTVRQVLQAFMLSLVVTFFLDITYTMASFVPMIFGFMYSFVNGVQRVVSILVYAGALVLGIIGILRVVKDQDAGLPLLSQLAWRIYGEQKPRPVRHPVYPQQPYVQPMQYPPQQAQPMPPMQGQPGVPQPPMPTGPVAPQPQPQVIPAAPQPPDLLSQTTQLPQPLVQPEQPPQQQ